MSGRTSLLLPALLLAVLVPCVSRAQDAAATPTAPVATVLLHLPALTPVVVKVDEEITSNRHKSGDRFRIFIAEDVRVGDTVVIPAGSAGEGEVVHAAKSGAGGKAGELILAARFVRVGDREVRLRSMAIGGAGRDKSDQAQAAAIAIGAFAMFVRGGALVIPPGTPASAKTAVEIELPVAEPTSPLPEVQPAETTNEGENHVSQST